MQGPCYIKKGAMLKNELLGGGNIEQITKQNNGDVFVFDILQNI